MKRVFWFSLLCFILPKAVQATTADPRDVFDKTVALRYTINVAAATKSTSTVLISLADTVNWPHKNTGSIDVSAINVGMDKVATTTCTVKIGVVNFVNTSTGSITWFHVVNSSNNVSNTGAYISHVMDVPMWKCRVNPNSTKPNMGDGTTPYILSNDTISGSSVFQTGTKLPSPTGNTAPGPGDIVMDVYKDGSGLATIDVEILYHSEQR